MAFPDFLSIFVTLACFLYGIVSSSSASTSCPSSAVAYNQLHYWSKNVRNNMPEVVLSKLSPLSKRESSYFTSLLSNQSFVADIGFCSIARLACSYPNPDLNHYDRNASQGSKLINYRPYGPYAANSSRGSELIDYRPYGPYAVNASRRSELIDYRPYGPYAVNASRGSELIDYRPYGPYVANISQASELIDYRPYGPYAANTSRGSELIDYRPYGPYVANASLVSKHNGKRPYVTNASLHQDLDDSHVFFRLSVLKIGNKVHIPKVLNHKFPHRSFLPFPIANKILMSSSAMKRIFPESFEFPVTRDAILRTIFYCNAPAIKGEIKSCPKSLPHMVGFSKAVLGKKYLSVFTTESGKGSGTDLLIQNIQNFDVQKLVVCHELYLPFATYFCHFLPSTHLYRIALADAETKITVNKVLAICHMDTSAIPADHVSLRALNLSPGQGEACHWMLATDLIWISNDKSVL